MSTEITTAMVRQFVGGIDLLQQQMDSRFSSRVRTETLTSAEHAEFDQVDATGMTDIASRHQDTVITDTPHRRRVVTPIAASVADLIDPPDLRRVINDPQNAYVQSFAAASNRKHDDRVIAAFFATSITGKGGTSTAAFDSTNYQVAVAASGMSLDKMRQASQKLKAAENMKDSGAYMWYLAYSSIQQQDLLEDSTITSADYNTVRALVDGSLSTFLGFEHVLSERLDTDSSSYRRCPAWVKQSMLLARSLTGRASIAVRPDKEDSIQVRYENDSGATRMDEKGVVEILADES